MHNAQKTFTIADPLMFDGNPFDVAGRTVGQIEAVVGLLPDLIEDARPMVRNAELQRQLQAGNEVDAGAWEDGPQARKLEKISGRLFSILIDLAALRAAAEFDPKNPPRIS